MRDGCVFCDYEGPSPVLEFLHDCLIFEPLNPVAEGHVIVVPKRHVASVGEARLWEEEDSRTVADAFRTAAFWSQVNHEAFNIIASSGEAATQTIRHLHVHVIPRRPGDGLALPWTERAFAGWICKHGTRGYSFHEDPVEGCPGPHTGVYLRPSA